MLHQRVLIPVRRPACFPSGTRANPSLSCDPIGTADDLTSALGIPIRVVSIAASLYSSLSSSVGSRSGSPGSLSSLLCGVTCQLSGLRSHFGRLTGLPGELNGLNLLSLLSPVTCQVGV